MWVPTCSLILMLNWNMPKCSIHNLKQTTYWHGQWSTPWRCHHPRWPASWRKGSCLAKCCGPCLPDSNTGLSTSYNWEKCSLYRVLRKTAKNCFEILKTGIEGFYIQTLNNTALRNLTQTTNNWSNRLDKLILFWRIEERKQRMGFVHCIASDC